MKAIIALSGVAAWLYVAALSAVHFASLINGHCAAIKIAANF
jgi:hypothetical protein